MIVNGGWFLSVWFKSYNLAVKKKTKRHFDLKAGQHFAFTAIDAPGCAGCWCPQHFFFSFGPTGFASRPS
jgi:hypothetical protein